MFAREIARVVSWVEGVLVDVFETEVVVVTVEVNEASVIAANVGALLPLTNTISALALAEVGARVGIGKGGEVLATLVNTSASLSYTNTILALVSIGASTKADIRVVREIEGALLGPQTDVSAAGKVPAVS